MSLIKLVDSASFFSKDEQLVTIIDFDKSKGLLKQASDSRIQEFASNITPESDKIYVHILAMGAGEYFGANRNADYFPEANLIEYHNTFVTSPAHIFRNHVNKRPEIAIGQVIFSIYNERMHRVEVIAWIDKVKGADIVERLEHGDFPATSMACKTAYDVCSICSNKAHTLQAYCEHLRNDLGKVYPDGRKVMALNLAPLKFFDMSIVIRPADVTSSVLQKLASNSAIIGSVEMALSEGISDPGVTKKAAFKKVSELIKEVDGQVVDYDPNLDPILDKLNDPETRLIAALSKFPLPEVVTTLAHMGISPSIAFLADLTAQSTIGPHMAGCGTIVEALMAEHGISNLEFPSEEEFCDHEPILKVAQILTPSLERCSLFPEYIMKRASHIMGTNVGYVGNGPHIEPLPQFNPEEFLNKADNTWGATKLVHTLLGVGATALILKWYISRQIDAKMKEMADANIHSGVKINLVKSASDYKIPSQLAKASVIKALKK